MKKFLPNALCVMLMAAVIVLAPVEPGYGVGCDVEYGCGSVVIMPLEDHPPGGGSGG